MKHKSKEELNKLASDIWNLELKCQKGENVSKNLQEMTNMTDKLSLADILLLADILESKGLQT